MTAAWAFGALGGATVGYAVFGDSPAEIAVSAAAGSGFGQKATQAFGKGIWRYGIVPIASGIALGSAIGTAISHIAWGDEGRDMAANYYKDFILDGPKAWDDKLIDTVDNIKTIWNHYL